MPRLWFLSLLVLLLAARPAAAFDTAAKAAIMIDYASGDVLLAKDPDEARPPASLTKLMTLDLVFSRLKSGNLKLDDELPVSAKAWRTGGSKMFVKVGDRVKVADLLRGIIVDSGNDACVVLAEALAGSEDAFAQRMNERAKAIGLEHSSFVNATGLPAEPSDMMSVRDLATLAHRIIHDYPEYYPIFAERSFTYSGITQQNRNPLLEAGVPGVDGMKTGFTDAAGYGLVASAERDGRRIILVLAGLELGAAAPLGGRAGARVRLPRLPAIYALCGRAGGSDAPGMAGCRPNRGAGGRGAHQRRAVAGRAQGALGEAALCGSPAGPHREGPEAG